MICNRDFSFFYWYMCTNCKVIYYGKTFHHLYIRVAEYMGISNLTGKCLKNVKQSPISDHLLQCNCAINFDDFSILATDYNKFKLLLRESLLIKWENPISGLSLKKTLHVWWLHAKSKFYCYGVQFWITCHDIMERNWILHWKLKISIKLNIGQKINGLEIMTLNREKI